MFPDSIMPLTQCVKGKCESLLTLTWMQVFYHLFVYTKVNLFGFKLKPPYIYVCKHFGIPHSLSGTRSILRLSLDVDQTSVHHV